MKYKKLVINDNFQLNYDEHLNSFETRVFPFTYLKITSEGYPSIHEYWEHHSTQRTSYIYHLLTGRKKKL